MTHGEGNIFLYSYDPFTKKYSDDGKQVPIRIWRDILSRNTPITKKIARLKKITQIPENLELRKILISSEVLKSIFSIGLDKFPNFDIVEIAMRDYNLSGFPKSIDPIDNKTINNNIRKLRLKGQITSTDEIPEKMPNLTVLEIRSYSSNYPIKQFPYSPKLQNLTLKNMSMKGNEFDHLPSDMFKNLREFECFSCGLTDEIAQKFQSAQLEKISVQDSKITDGNILPIFNQKLKTLQINNNKIDKNIDNTLPIHAENIEISGNAKISKFNDLSFPNATEINFFNNETETVENIYAPHLVRLQLGSNKISKFETGPLPKVQKIELNNNRLHHIIISPELFPKLTELDLDHNELETLHGITSPTLKTIHLIGNNFKNFEGINAPNLEKITISNIGRNFKGLPPNPDIIITIHTGHTKIHNLAGLSKAQFYKNFIHYNEFQFFSDVQEKQYQKCLKNGMKCDRVFTYLNRDIDDELKKLEDRSTPIEDQHNSIAYITQNATKDDLPFIDRTISAINASLSSLNKQDADHYNAIKSVLETLRNHNLYITS